MDHPDSSKTFAQEAARTVKTPMVIKVIADVLQERQAQDRKWGEQNYPPEKWLAILAEEFGEVSKEVCEYTFTKELSYQEECLAKLKTELIQTAAVCVAMIESLERNEIREGGR